MNGNDILQLSNFYALSEHGFMPLLAHLQENGLTEPGALLISGLTRSGDADDFHQVTVNLQSLIRILSLDPSQVILLPSIADLQQGYAPFDIAYEALFERRYDYQHTQLVTIGNKTRLQVFGLDTTLYQSHPVTEFQFLTRLSKANEHEPTSPKLIRAAFFHDPVDLFHQKAIQASCRDHHVYLGIHGELYSRSFGPPINTVSIGENRFNYLRFIPSLRKMTSIIAAFRDGRWSEPIMKDFHLNIQEPHENRKGGFQIIP